MLKVSLQNSFFVFCKKSDFYRILLIFSTGKCIFTILGWVYCKAVQAISQYGGWDTGIGRSSFIDSNSGIHIESPQAVEAGQKNLT
jgi:hypothetical protein